ncbi:hypothetical protein ILUMI_12926 [Ignelater luminosus]|uniref:Uncharacterized protein n=1 Tax=Ignelater luminosus TaxID=2038154 RepID=A0A8K0CXK6_IGNLU|nr:hypothetical protein ILUMI_12926 [Ignelater luminosus]
MSGRILRDLDSSVAWPAKRKRQPRKSDIIKKQKVAGEAHINHKGLHKPARTTGLDCRTCSVLTNLVNTSSLLLQILHGITRGRLGVIQDSFRSSRVPLREHSNRPTKSPDEVINLIRLHIKSFRGRQSHYSRRDSPDRTDTCCKCDELILKIESAEDATIKPQLAIEKELHLRKTEKFTQLKKHYKLQARAGKCMAISFDFQQNLPLPHIRTDDIFRFKVLLFEANLGTYCAGDKYTLGFVKGFVGDSSKLDVDVVWSLDRALDIGNEVFVKHIRKVWVSCQD